MEDAQRRNIARGRTIQGLRDLADLLESNPNIPIGMSRQEVTVHRLSEMEFVSAARSGLFHRAYAGSVTIEAQLPQDDYAGQPSMGGVEVTLFPETEDRVSGAIEAALSDLTTTDE